MDEFNSNLEPETPTQDSGPRLDRETTIRLVPPADTAPGSIAGLDIMDLATIFQTLSANRRTGTLKLTNARGDERFLYFGDGRIRLVSAASAERTFLEGALLKSKCLSREKIDELKAKSWAKGQPLSTVLLQRARVPASELAEALLAHMTEEVTDLFAWKDVHCEFFPERIAGEQLDPQLAALTDGLSADAVLMEAMRRADEWECVEQCFDTTKEVFEFTEKGADALEEETRQELLALVDGYRDVSEVIAHSTFSRFEVCTVLMELFLVGRLRAKDAAQLAAMGDMAAAQTDWAKALRLFEHARELDASQMDLLAKLGAAHEALGNLAAAKDLLSDYVAKNMAQGASAEAARACRHLVKIDPDDPESHAMLFRALFTAEDRAGLRPAGKALVLAYEKKGAVDRAAEILNRLRGFFPEDEEIREMDARMRLANAERTEALVEFEDLAESYLARGDLEGAVRTFHKILEEIDEECLEARLQLADCLVKLERTKEAVAEYQRLTEILSRTGLIDEGDVPPFFLQVHHKLVELDPDNPSPREWLAETYAAADNTEAALTEFDGLADLYTRVKNVPKVIATLRRVVELFPEQLLFRERLANLYLGEKGTPEKARTELAALCQAAEELEDYEVGTRAAEKLIEIDPFHMEAHILLAAALRAGGDAEAAADKFQAIALMYLGAGLPAQAEEALKLVLELDERDDEAHRLLAGLLEERGEHEEAARLYKAGARLAFEDRDYGSAETGYRRALRLEPDDWNTSETLKRLTESRKKRKK